MMRRFVSCRWVSCVLGAGALAFAARAEASGFSSSRFGSDEGNPVGENPFAIYFNPAALTGVHGTQLALDGTFAFRHATFDRPTSSLSPEFNPRPDAAYERGNTGTAKLNNLITVPFVGIASDFGGSRFFGGLASYVPFGGVASWSRPGPANAPLGDGPQRWADLSGTFLSLYNTAAFGVRIPEAGLSFAVSGTGVVSKLSSLRARNGNGSDDYVAADGSLVEGRALLDVSGLNVAAAVGALWQSHDDGALKIGISYTARPGFGEMRWKGTLKTALGSHSPTSQDVDLLQTFPDVVRFGGSYQISNKLLVRADVEYVTWSSFRHQCVVARGATCDVQPNGKATSAQNSIILNLERRWQNAGQLRVGASYSVDEATDVFGSLGFDTSAVPDATLDASFIDAFKLLPTVGVRHRFGEAFALGASYNHAFYFTRDTTATNTLNALQAPSKQPNEGGVYKQQFAVANLNGTFFFLRRPLL